VANHRRETGLDSVAANPPGLPPVPAPGPRSPPRSSPDPLGLWFRRQAPGTHHIFTQDHGIVLGNCLGSPLPVRKRFPRGQARPMFIPADGLRIYRVPQSACRKRPPLISRWHCSWKKVFYSSMLVPIICAYDFVRMISFCV